MSLPQTKSNTAAADSAVVDETSVVFCVHVDGKRAVPASTETRQSAQMKGLCLCKGQTDRFGCCFDGDHRLVCSEESSQVRRTERVDKI